MLSSLRRKWKFENFIEFDVNVNDLSTKKLKRVNWIWCAINDLYSLGTRYSKHFHWIYLLCNENMYVSIHCFIEKIWTAYLFYRYITNHNNVKYALLFFVHHYFSLKVYKKFSHHDKLSNFQITEKNTLKENIPRGVQPLYFFFS